MHCLQMLNCTVGWLWWFEFWYFRDANISYIYIYIHILSIGCVKLRQTNFSKFRFILRSSHFISIFCSCVCDYQAIAIVDWNTIKRKLVCFNSCKLKLHSSILQKGRTQKCFRQQWNAYIGNLGIAWWSFALKWLSFTNEGRRWRKTLCKQIAYEYCENEIGLVFWIILFVTSLQIICITDAVVIIWEVYFWTVNINETKMQNERSEKANTTH